MCHELLADARLYEQLLRFDEDLADQVRSGGCGCGGKLHRAPYPRKPRGMPVAIEGYEKRLSFCCDRDGCRARATPPSFRFLGRRVYLGAIVVLVSAMKHGVVARRAGALWALVGVDRRTLGRWRRWWREAFVATPSWREHKARFMPPVSEAELPGSLLARFGGGLREQLLAVLELLLPLSTSRSSMVGLDPQRMLVAGRDRGR